MTPKRLKELHQEITDGKQIEAQDAAWLWNVCRVLAHLADRDGLNAEAMKELGPIGQTEQVCSCGRGPSLSMVGCCAECATDLQTWEDLDALEDRDALEGLE